MKTNIKSKSKNQKSLKGGSECLHGIKQFSSTCYSNSVFNAFLIGTIARKILYKQYNDYLLEEIINNNTNKEEIGVAHV